MDGSGLYSSHPQKVIHGVGKYLGMRVDTDSRLEIHWFATSDLCEQVGY